MALRNDDDLGPALLALGALVLGIGVIVAVWTLREPRPGVERADDWRRAPGEEGPEHAEILALTDAGVGEAPFFFEREPWAASDETAPFEDELDPQVLAMRRSMRGGPDAGVRGFSPYRGTGRAIVASGVPGVGRESSCDLRVLPVSAAGGAFNCVVRVRCDGVVVYPDNALEAGYAPCEVENGVPRLATDGAPSMRDGDPELLVDLGRHVARVHDRRFEGDESLVEIRLD